MWCPRCQNIVKTWKGSYVRNRVKITTTLCRKCNTILKVEHKSLETKDLKGE